MNEGKINLEDVMDTELDLLRKDLIHQLGIPVEIENKTNGDSPDEDLPPLCFSPELREPDETIEDLGCVDCPWNGDCH